MDRNTKQVVIDKLSSELKDAQIIVISDFRGLKVSKLTEFRKFIREQKIKFKIVKNTMLKNAIKNTKFEVLNEILKGPVSITYSDNPVETIKTLQKFDPKGEIIKIKGGALKGQLLNKDQIHEISKLPSKEILLGNILSLFNSSSQNMVSVLSGPIRSFIGVLQNIKEKKEKEEDSAQSTDSGN